MNRSVLTGCIVLLAAYAANAQSNSAYPLGPDDQISIHAMHVPEMPDKPLRIEADGYVRLPLVGRIQAAGLTPVRLEEELRKRLAVYVEEPEVSVELIEQHSQPVSVLGAVKTPGVQQLHGNKSLVEVLAMAGGVDADAGYSLRIARRIEEGPLPLPSARRDLASPLTVADVNLQEVMDGASAACSLIVKPHDVITVPRAKMIYVIGEVKKSGGFVLHERENMTVLQALSMAEGLNRTAGPKNARILRPLEPGAARQVIPVNLSAIQEGKSPDLALQPDDILLVPNSATKSAMLRTMEAAIQIGTGIVVWGRL